MFKYFFLATLPIIFTSCFHPSSAVEKKLQGVYTRIDTDQYGTIWDTLSILPSSGHHHFTIERLIGLQATADNGRMTLQHRHEHWTGTFVPQEEVLLIVDDEQVYYQSDNKDTLDNGVIKYARLPLKH